jgi:hypothetical protein
MVNTEVLNYKRNVTIGDLKMTLPYSKGDLWILGDQVLECINDSGNVINFQDWTIADSYKYVPELQ